VTPVLTTMTDVVLEHLPGIVYVATPHNRTVYVSPQIERILGVPSDAWGDDPDAWPRRIHPEDRERVLAEMEDSRRPGRTFRSEYRMLRPDGTVVWLLDEATHVRDANGHVLVTHGMVLDITDRKLAEAEAAARGRELRTLYRISEIALAARPLDETYRAILDTISEATGMPMAAIALYDEATGSLTYRCTQNLPAVLTGVSFRVDVEESFSAAVIRTGRPFTWTSAEPLPPSLHATLRALGIQTFLSVPMTVRGRVIGALGLSDREARPITSAMVDLAASIGNHVAVLVERHQTESALRASEQHFHAMFDSALDAMLVVDDTRTYVAVNASAARLFGVLAEELRGRRFGDFAAPGTDIDRAWQALIEKRTTSGEWRLVRPDGTVREVESSVTPQVLPGRHLFVVRDLTERLRAAAAARVRSTALAAVANGIVITDPDGRIEWVNPEFTRMTGFSLEDVRGQTPRVLKSGLHDPSFYAALWRTIRKGRVWRGEMVNRRKDGTLYHEEQSITPTFGDDGRLLHFVAIKQDISDRKRSDDALRQSEEYHRALIENALDLIVVLDANGTITYASPSVHAVLGHQPDAMVGSNALTQLHPDDVARISTLFFAGQRTPGHVSSAQFRFRHADGSWRTLEGVGRNLLDHPSVAGIIVNARDVTERQQHETTQARLREQLAHSEKLAAMSELLAGVAHELNNPLSVVMGHTALLGRTADAAVAARAEKIGRAAERCGRIVKNFLALARQYPPERTAVPLNQVITEALEVMAYALRVDDVQVTTDLDSELPMLSADRHQLQQVLVNLVTNAHQALRSQSGPRQLVIRSGADQTAERVWLEVADDGPGVPPAVAARLFEPFFTTKPVGQGTGLGLSICRGIVESHGGQITLRPSGPGATFRVELPMVGPMASPPALDDDGPTVSARRILVVDDEVEVGAVISEFLRRDGHTVATAANGVEALNRLQQERYDAVLSDIKMPLMDGPELWRAVEQIDPSLTERFVFFTGDTLSAATNEFLTATGAPSLRKPFVLRDLRRALARVPQPAAAPPDMAHA